MYLHVHIHLCVCMCACSTHVHVCMQYSCTCVHAVLMYMCACSTQDQPHPISQLSSPALTSVPKSPEYTESISSSLLSTGRDPTSQPLQGEVVCTCCLDCLPQPLCVVGYSRRSGW